MILGIYFALSSGTVDSIVYDVVLEETGSSKLYETWIGRVTMIENGVLVVSALAGGAIAGWASARVASFATLPFVAASAVAVSAVAVSAVAVSAGQARGASPRGKAA
ncbi:hypothetical protein ThrDRAFT_01796 [Frankia casuarinae]|jgi:hypothetical protein|uniref:MFS transporter n=2 Tax=Frankia casuarinae (strain DSM 45818 / CECT 9043 / HFP020203 / CcI3) TaxID=106370 RepID=Q2J9R1_FRACC|nr:MULTISPECIES: hypothetical protein [unclassified Frankia]ABD11981.1 hypothetical protein Francci3_2619 [Frankia casuarinae]ETA01876.1 hypothetical protein CcI6DRAFT_02724 [Frankia sp. CcI6]EYT92513.1 hypothetical protein ThrDRAFT_01796 [Frankia casuarinae]KFB04490.1 hypothetical protein ALLO2DRAFT_02773 [Frankia sp. Allo2]OAA24299.1 hypothetical protein AAY23_104725 [Frankia casuarinae]